MIPVLDIRGLNAWYGESHVLHDLNLQVHGGQVVTLLGRNGAGRTTTLRAVLGLTGRRTGSIQVLGTECIGLSTHRVARLGIGYCPEERGMFASLSAHENLLLPPVLPEGGPRMTVEEIYGLFPNLWSRRASPAASLSGGEQQMLALARILRTGARLLLLDEISEGLAPVIVKALGRAIAGLKARGYTVLLVEQNFRFAAPLADRFHVMEHGRVVDEFDAMQLAGRMPTLHRLLGI